MVMCAVCLYVWYVFEYVCMCVFMCTCLCCCMHLCLYVCAHMCVLTYIKMDCIFTDMGDSQCFALLRLETKGTQQCCPIPKARETEVVLVPAF